MTATDISLNGSLPAHGPILYDVIFICVYTCTCLFYMANGLNKELLNLNTILLSKLEMYGIRNNELRWFHNYLTGLSQVVSVNGAISDSHDIHVGVPQGSVLGALLFIVFFINDLPSVVNRCKITFDTELFFLE